MHTRRLSLTLLTTCFLPLVAAAQVIGAAGEDARVAPRGTVGISVGGAWSRWSERFGRLTSSGADGSAVPLGSTFTIDSLGPRQVESLLGAQQSIRALAATPGFSATLGQMRLGLRDQITDTPVGLSLGLWGRMELSALVPFITTRAESQLRVNPTGREATVAFNPARTVAAALAANSLLLTQFDSATAQVNRRLTFCAANAASTGCAAVNASAATARAAVQDATNFATGVAALYGGRAGGRGAPFVPISGSAAQTAIDARIATFRTLFATFGSSALTSSGPFAAQVALTTADAATLLSDSAYGIGARALGFGLPWLPRQRAGKY